MVFIFFSKAPSLDLQHELENKTIDVQEKNTEISKLNQTLKRVIEEKKRAEMNSKKRTLMHYERLISDTRKKYIELKDEMLWSAIKKNDKSTDEILSQISKEFLEEHETLKRKYFFTLALAIKLTLSENKITNIDVQNLYDTGKYLPFLEWDEWIQQRLEKPI